MNKQTKERIENAARWAESQSDDTKNSFRERAFQGGKAVGLRAAIDIIEVEEAKEKDAEGKVDSRP